MSHIHSFDHALNAEEKKIMARLDTPYRIQELLDAFRYSSDAFYRCPLRVLRERTAHCFDGALFAAAALRRLGHPPLVLDILPNERDDDHMLALFKIEGYWGAVAKSNFVGLRYREPVFRSLRELVMSYFEHYYNVAREKTMRGYTRPLNLASFDEYPWMIHDAPLDRIADRLDAIRRYRIVTRSMEKRLSLLDERSAKAGLLGANEAGLFRVEGKS